MCMVFSECNGLGDEVVSGKKVKGLEKVSISVIDFVKVKWSVYILGHPW